MQLKKTNNYPQSKKRESPKTPRQIDLSTYEIDYFCEIPHGKYVGRTLQWIIDNDDWYYNWMQENNIISDWNLYKLKEESTPKKQYNHFISNTGETWIGLRLVDKTDNFINSPFL